MTRDEWRAVRSEPALLLFVITLIGLSVFRLRLAAQLPLWIDESYTLMIARQPDWAATVRQMWLDPSAPLYYLIMALVPGNSDFTLRLPGYLFLLAAAVLPLLWRIPKVPPVAAICWGVLLFAWNSGMVFSADARPYALLLLCSTAQTIAFARLIDQPTLRRAFAWTGCAALAIATHYYAGVLGLLQGIALLILLRARALRLWPALFMLIPALGLFVWQLPRLAEFAAPGVAWYSTLSATDAFAMFLGLIGPFWWVVLAIVVAARLIAPPAPMPTAAATAAWCGLATIILLEIGGILRPMLVDRYLAPGVPGLFLLLLLLAGNRLAQIAIAAAFIASSTLGVRERMVDRSMFSAERAADTLLAAGPAPTRIVYSLGYNGQRVLDPSTTSGLVETEFARRGMATRATLVPTLEAGPLEQAAGTDGALLWFYDAAQRIAAEALLSRRPGCRNLPRAAGGTLVCVPLERVR